jgi:hypothetical protein
MLLLSGMLHEFCLGVQLQHPVGLSSLDSVQVSKVHAGSVSLHLCTISCCLPPSS